VIQITVGRTEEEVRDNYSNPISTSANPALTDRRHADRFALPETLFYYRKGKGGMSLRRKA